MRYASSRQFGWKPTLFVLTKASSIRSSTHRTSCARAYTIHRAQTRKQKRRKPAPEIISPFIVWRIPHWQFHVAFCLFLHVDASWKRLATGIGAKVMRVCLLWGLRMRMICCIWCIAVAKVVTLTQTSSEWNRGKDSREQHTIRHKTLYADPNNDWRCFCCDMSACVSKAMKARVPSVHANAAAPNCGAVERISPAFVWMVNFRSFWKWLKSANCLCKRDVIAPHESFSHFQMALVAFYDDLKGVRSRGSHAWNRKFIIISPGCGAGRIYVLMHFKLQKAETYASRAK